MKKFNFFRKKVAKLPEPPSLVKVHVGIKNGHANIAFSKGVHDISLNTDGARDLANGLLAIANTIDANILASKTQH